MTCRPRMLAGAAAAGIVAASGFVVLQDSDGPSRLERPSATRDGDPAVRGCRERVEGSKIVPDRALDTVIGPMAFIRLPSSYRDYASRPDSDLEPYPPVGLPTMKVIGVLRAGSRVTLVVPRSERRWMKVVYDFPGLRGASPVTLEACDIVSSPRARRRECGWRPDRACQWGYTQFNGGFGLDFANAPRRGACAELLVRVRGRAEPLRALLFDPERGTCRPALARAPTTIVKACAEAAADAAFGVLCPARWPTPRGRGAGKARVFEHAPGVYLIDVANGFRRRGGHVFHLLVGGQRRPFGRWPAGVDPNLRLTTRRVAIPIRGGGTYVQDLPARRIAGARVRRARAAVLREPPFPQGGIHGGHVVVLWNEGGHGYLVSVHGERLSQRALVSIALAIARSAQAGRPD